MWQYFSHWMMKFMGFNLLLYLGYAILNSWNVKKGTWKRNKEISVRISCCFKISLGDCSCPLKVYSFKFSDGMATGWHRRSRPYLATYRAWEGPFPAIWEAHFAKFHSYATREPMIAYGLQILGKSNSKLVICQIGVQGRGRGQTVPKFPQDLNFWHGFAQPFES